MAVSDEAVEFVPDELLRKLFNKWGERIDTTDWSGELSLVEYLVSRTFGIYSTPINSKVRLERRRIQLKYPDILPKFEEVLAEKLKKTASGQTLPPGARRIAERQQCLDDTVQYNLQELHDLHIISSGATRVLIRKGYISSPDQRMFPINWGFALAYVNNFDACRALGFTAEHKYEVDLINLERMVGTGKEESFSKEEQKIMAELKKVAYSEVVGPIEWFYLNGRRFMAEPPLTLLWVAAQVVHKGNIVPDGRARYAAYVSGVLEGYLSRLKNTARIARENGGLSIPSAEPDDTLGCLGNKLRFEQYIADLKMQWAQRHSVSARR